MIVEKNKKSGVGYAFTDDGIELPVMDITHPAFVETAGPAELDALAKDFLEFQKSPAFFRRFFSQRSIAMRGLGSAAGKFLGGMTTYVAKLKPALLGKGYAGMIDRKVAGGIGSVAFRLRLQDVAHLMAEELAPLIAAGTGRALHLLNIGGGPAMDSLNALILIQKEHPEWLAGRRVTIHVLDLDRAGPSFGARALAALQAPGAPLHGLEIALEHVAYDWADAAELGKLGERLGGETVLLGSSEGGLFEYGSDAVIGENLRALQAGFPAGCVMVGSLFRDGTIPRWLQASSKMSIRTFELEAFRNLVGSVGWAVDRVKESNPIYRVVSLKVIRPSAA
jgi:hypothetical protein